MIAHPHDPSPILLTMLAAQSDDGHAPLRTRGVASPQWSEVEILRADGSELSATERAHVLAVLAAHAAEPIRERAARATDRDRAAACGYADDPARCGLPRIEIIAMVGRRLTRCNIGLRVDELAPGAREAVDAGLASTDRRDDASQLIYRTGRSRGEAAAMRRAAMTPEELSVYAASYPPDDDASPEIAFFAWCGAWYPHRETPEAYLSRVLGHLAGRIVRAGL